MDHKPPIIVAAEEPEIEEPVEVALPPEKIEIDPQAGARFPAWAKIPEGLKFPAGRDILFVPLPLDLMEKKTGGEIIVDRRGNKRLCRQLILWAVNLGDKKIARKRAAGDILAYQDELTLQMIRAIDGEPVAWSAMSSSAYPPRIWGEMGEQLRNLLHRLYSSMHVLSQEHVDDFFGNLIELRRAASE